MPLPPPALIVYASPIFLPAAALSRATGGYSLALLIPLGVILGYTGLLYMANYRDVWRKHLEWQRQQPRRKLLATNLAREEWANDGWRIVSGQIALTLGVALVALGICGLVGVFR